MSYELTGTLEEKFNTVQITPKFSKREFVIEKIEQIGNNSVTNHVKFQLINDRCDLIDPYATGEEVKIHFNIKGRKHEKDGNVMYFTNLEAWRVERMSSEQASRIDPEPDYNISDVPPEMEEDDLPF